MKHIRMLVSILVLGLLLNACGTPINDSADLATPTEQAVAVQPTSIPPTPTPELTAEKIAERLRPSTVMVRADFPETAVSSAGYGSGTGIVFTADGYIVTNAHVVEGASAVTVALSGSQRQLPARVVGRSGCDDLAVLKIDPVEGLAPATFGHSSALKVGEQVYALGYPLGEETGVEFSITQGIVSKRDLALDQYQSLIQTDAAINPGNSGGPLVNHYGQVVGINSLGFNANIATSINFAISIDAAQSVIRSLQGGTNQQWLGLNLVPNTFKDYFGTEQGVVVAAVDSGSPAAKAGVIPASLLLSLEGSDVNSVADVCKILRSHSDGDQLKVKLFYTDKTDRWRIDGEIALGTPDQVTKKLDVQPIRPTPTPEPQADFSDDFSTNNAGWETGSTEGSDEAVSDGAYHMILKHASVYALSPLNTEQNINDSLVGIDVLVRGNARAGVAQRYSNSQAGKSYIACWIDGANQYGCFVSVNNQWTTLAEPTASNAINAGKVNRVALQVIGQQVDLLINGTPVASFTDNRVASGVPALYVENFDAVAGASFDNLAVYLPK